MLSVWDRDKFNLLINKDTETSKYSVEMSDSVFHTHRCFLTKAMLTSGPQVGVVHVLSL